MAKQKYSFPTDRKEYGPKSSRKGGNRKGKTYRLCVACNKEFGPLENKHRRYCSKKCWYENKPKPALYKQYGTKEAFRACRKLRYHVETGKIKKPIKCEECKMEKRLEGAHFNYIEALRVRWLCKSCHIKWDKKEPKGGTYLRPIIDRWEKFTGQKSDILPIKGK